MAPRGMGAEFCNELLTQNPRQGGCGAHPFKHPAGRPSPTRASGIGARGREARGRLGGEREGQDANLPAASLSGRRLSLLR